MLRALFAAATLLSSATAAVWANDSAGDDWTYYGGSKYFDRYSSANSINPSNVQKLKILWTRPAIDANLQAAYPGMRAPGYFSSSVIEIGGTLYGPNGAGLVEAFDAKTGKTVWSQKPFDASRGEINARPSRGLAYWASGTDRRIVSIRGAYLYQLDAASGEPVAAFGERGRVSLDFKNRDGARFHSTGGPIVANDVIVIGGSGASRGDGDYGFNKESTPAQVRGFDVRTGKQLWSFSAMPQADDPAIASWGEGSAQLGGDMASWGQLSADEDLGYVYVALSAPNLPIWGGWRPGDNLYSNSLVALDIKTGRKIWHYQMLHHDVWDWDAASPPVLGDVTIDGRRVKAVFQTGKNPMLFAFDRVTGKPLWPIEERPVPASDVKGERLSPTQPFPTKPAALDRLGISADDLIDFTPALRKEALEIVKKYRMGPMFSPPSLFSDKPGETRGTIVLPGTHGGAGWNTGAFDPERGVYYGVTMTAPSVYAMERPTNPKATVEYVMHIEDESWYLKGPRGLPLVKPPYGRITAVDMNRGEKLWAVANGDGPRFHPELKGLNLPPLGIPGRPAAIVTKSLIFVGEGSDAINMSDLTGGYGNNFRAYDKSTGQVLATVELPAGTTGSPATFLVEGKQYVVVAVGGKTQAAQWVALGL